MQNTKQITRQIDQTIDSHSGRRSLLAYQHSNGENLYTSLGCMNYLQINDEDVHLYKDALSGRDIVECKTTVCAIQPCKIGRAHV